MIFVDRDFLWRELQMKIIFFSDIIGVIIIGKNCKFMVLKGGIMVSIRRNTGRLKRFYLNMQMIVDELQEKDMMFRYCPGDSSEELLDVRIYQEMFLRNRLERHQLLIVTAKMFREWFLECSEGSFLVIGEVEEFRNDLRAVVFLEEDVDVLGLLNLVQDVFERNNQWVGKLKDAMLEDCTLNELCEISQPYFQNPLFIHNPQFYILGTSGWVTGMSEWDYDQTTGRDMVSTDLINYFKTDQEYLDTLDTSGAQVYVGDFRSFRCAYVNLWNTAGGYEGRLCINELQTSIKPGQIHAMEYLAGLIILFLQKKSINEQSSVQPFERFLCEILEGTAEPHGIYDTLLERQRWNLQDRFICVKLSVSQRDIHTRSVTGICNLIRAEFEAACAFPYENHILAVLNLTKMQMNLNECLSRFSTILREGLLKAGSSNEFQDLFVLPQAYRQADIALIYGNQRSPMKWCHKFQEIAMYYCICQVCQNLEPHAVCAPGLLKLQAYDQENESDLYHTLDIYLQTDRNTVQTAQKLYIHRSTLFYRLNKIKKILEMDLEDYEECLYLRFSLYMMSQLPAAEAPENFGS